MQGIYRINIAGKVHEYTNVITNAGKVRILEAVAGKASGFADSMIAGIDITAAADTDRSLGFPVGGGNINVRIADPVNKKIYFKSTLPSLDNYEIRELGCYSTNFNSMQNSTFGTGSVLLAVFGSSTPWVNVTGTAASATTNNKIGTDSLQYAINNTTVNGYMNLPKDYSNLPTTATFDLAYFANNLTNLTVRFKVDSANYFQTTAYSLTNGYNISKVQLGSFVATGTPSWANIQQFEILATSTSANGLLSLDGLRYSFPPSAENSLLSRVVLGTPLQKLAGVTVDIEYVLSLGL